MPIKKPYSHLVTDDMARAFIYSIGQVRGRKSEAPIETLGIVDSHKLERIGTLVEAFTAPLNMLGFRIDPDSHSQPLFSDEFKECSLYCGAGWQPKPCRTSE